MAAPRVLGAHPLEFQLRRARAAGVGHVVIHVDRMTSALLASTERLRSEGLSIDIARTVNDAAEMIHPDEAVLILSPDLILSSARLTSVATAAEPVLLCVRDEPANERFELIDATARWTGFARIDGALLRRTAAMVGDWDFASTLMRRAVQEGAARETLIPEQAGADLMLIDSGSAARAAGRRLIATTPVADAGGAMHWLIAPVARMIARSAGEFGLEPQWVTLAGIVLFGAAAACAMAGWIVASLLLFLFGQTCDVASCLSTRAGAATLRWEKFRGPVGTATAMIVILAMGTTLTLRTAQWGCLVLSMIIIGATWLAAPLAHEDASLSKWRSDPGGHAVIGLTGFALFSPVAALIMSAAHAVFSLGWVMRKGGSGLARP